MSSWSWQEPTPIASPLRQRMDTSPYISRHHEFQRIAQPQLEKYIVWGSQRVYGISANVGSHGWRASINRFFPNCGERILVMSDFFRMVSTISLKKMHGNIMWHLSIGKFHCFTNLDFPEIRGRYVFLAFGIWIESFVDSFVKCIGPFSLKLRGCPDGSVCLNVCRSCALAVRGHVMKCTKGRELMRIWGGTRFFPSAKMFEYTANIWWVFLEDLKGIHLNTGLTYRNLQHLNGDESRNDHTPFEHFVISFCSGICNPYNILSWWS